MTQVLWEHREGVATPGAETGKTLWQRGFVLCLEGRIEGNHSKTGKRTFQEEGLANPKTELWNCSVTGILGNCVLFSLTQSSLNVVGWGSDKEETGELSVGRIMKGLECHGWELVLYSVREFGVVVKSSGSGITLSVFTLSLTGSVPLRNLFNVFVCLCFSPKWGY